MMDSTGVWQQITGVEEEWWTVQGLGNRLHEWKRNGGQYRGLAIDYMSGRGMVDSTGVMQQTTGVEEEWLTVQGLGNRLQEWKVNGGQYMGYAIYYRIIR